MQKDDLDGVIDDLIKKGQAHRIIYHVDESKEVFNKGSRRKQTVQDREYAIWKRNHEAKLQKKYEQEKWKLLAEEQRRKEAEHRRKRKRYLRPIED
jgi:hypothetical protein